MQVFKILTQQQKTNEERMKRIEKKPKQKKCVQRYKLDTWNQIFFIGITVKKKKHV